MSRNKVCIEADCPYNYKGSCTNHESDAEECQGSKMELWIVGKVVESSEWEFDGVFDSEEKAIAACKSENHFIGPAILNKEIPEDCVEWSGAYYPLIEDKPE